MRKKKVQPVGEWHVINQDPEAPETHEPWRPRSQQLCTRQPGSPLASFNESLGARRWSQRFWGRDWGPRGQGGGQEVKERGRDGKGGPGTGEKGYDELDG